MEHKNIVILGGSYGGISTAHYLLRHVLPTLPSPESYQIVLVSTSSQTMCRPACPRAMISDDMFPQDRLFVNIAPLFEQYPKGRFRFVQGTAIKLDHSNRAVDIQSNGDTQKIDFHAIVIATGSSTTSPLMGFDRDESFLREQWTALRAALPTAKSIVVAGGGPTGIEIAGELGEHFNGRSGCHNSNPKVPITLVTSSSQILPVLRPAIAKKAEKFLADVGVTVKTNTRVQTVSPPDAGMAIVDSKATLTLDDGSILTPDIYIPATGISPNSGFLDAALLARDGRVQTDHTCRVDQAGPRVYAVGDVASNVQANSVIAIFSCIPVLCANVKRDLLLAEGKEGSAAGSDRVFTEDTRTSQIVPIGRSKGVGEVMGWQIPSFLVWLAKGRDYWLWTTADVWNGNKWAKAS
ncbi:FAD/NAD(P)-binding domain-containing protein [Aspergillus heteromorphus CBS 117.55]|uniref:FAD/NAD(P)-binding domain-containing protein n=1 Tax=Aspergillus heteromorphus CBS 117.55 TaxID=1448321 RepID=A0A317X1Q4_9EURO|nr:FAD/NAD(P)-binding domain-containing protein [Aspergillus heteromorphus CBS 117.55]PWY92275.1 FAD/NAD(P)-binding domain-containing protein [Aspergillus heteromorphus CBS 117.55]